MILQAVFRLVYCTIWGASACEGGGPGYEEVPGRNARASPQRALLNSLSDCSNLEWKMHVVSSCFVSLSVLAADAAELGIAGREESLDRDANAAPQRALSKEDQQTAAI